MLLRGLYAETLELLTGGSQAQSRPEREAAAREALAERARRLAGGGGRAPNAPGTTPPTGSASTPARTRSSPTWCASSARASRRSHVELDFERDATQACFAMSDHPGIFARLAGALALAGANVVDARTYTTTDGIATAAFWIQDAEGKPYEQHRLVRLRNSGRPDAQGRDRRPRGAEGQGPGQAARARLRGADPDQLRQHRLGHLHHHRGRDPRPAGPALRPRAHADGQQHLDRLARSSPPTASRRSTSSTSRTSSG